MNELIKITERDGKQLVSARELYQFLEYDSSQWSRWALKNIVKDEYFVEYEDYTKLDTMSNHQRATDYAITLDMAKELSMLARNIKGKQARKYFIEVDKKSQLPAFEIPQTYSAALLLASKQAEQIELQKVEIKQLEPKGEFYDAVTGSNDTIDIGSVAKVLNLGIGRNKLFQKLRDNSILMSNNQPYQNYVDRGYFRVIESKFNKPDGSTCISLKTVVYQKGVDYIKGLVNKK